MFCGVTINEAENVLDEAQQALKLGEPQVCLDLLNVIEKSSVPPTDELIRQAVELAAQATVMELARRPRKQGNSK